VVGLVLREHDKAPLEVRYRLEADGSYRVGAVRVTADTAAGPLDLSMRADGVSHWHQQGMRLPWLDGCRDVYFDFSPAPLVLTVSRLALRVGERAEARVACVRYPFLDAEAAVFGFERLDEERTSVSGPKVSTVLHLDERGMLVDYEGGWSEIARA
jgi:hypothetical protein